MRYRCRPDPRSSVMSDDISTLRGILRDFPDAATGKVAWFG
jgi:hypothetical protein